MIDINGKLWRKSSESKLSKAERKAEEFCYFKENAISRKGLSVKGNHLEKWNSTYPENRLKRSPRRGAEKDGSVLES